MKFEKKLIILSGENNAKGTISLERNAYGTFATFNIFNIPDKLTGEYVAGIKTNDSVFVRKLGSMGRILSRFKINDIALSAVHCIIFDSLTETPVLYGTNDTRKLWEANMMDGIRSKKVEFKAEIEKANIEKALPSYSQRPEEAENPNDIDSFFLDVIPKEQYRDSAIAQVNYYPSELKLEVSYTNRDTEKREETNKVDNEMQKIANENNNIESGNKPEDAENLMPWQLAKQYIKKYKKESVILEEYKEENAQNQLILDEAVGKNTEELISEEKLKAEKIEAERLEAERLEAERLEAEKILEEQKEAERLENEKILEQLNPVRIESVYENECQNCEKEALEPVKEMKKPRVMINQNQDKDNSGEFEAAATIPPLSSFTARDALNKNIQIIFYEQVKSQLDELFKNNPEYQPLSKIMPDTKWVKVDFDNNGKYYVVGLIGSKPDYLCYGVPAKYSVEPPNELNGYCQWLPLDGKNPEGDGFWLMFQDAVSGESVRSLE